MEEVNVLENDMHDAPPAPTDVPVVGETDHPELQNKQPTLAEYKRAMNQYFTVRRATVNECGHKYNDMDQPRNNCEFCWFAYLNSHGDLVKLADEVFWKDQGKLLARLKGDKFVKMFKRFMSTVARWKEEAEALRGQNGEGNTGSNETNEEGLVRESTEVGIGIERATEDNNIVS